MIRHEGFAVFILTHGREDNVVTYSTLRRQGYSGKIYLILDNEDEQRPAYERRFGKDSIVVFDKAQYFAKSDTIDNNGNRAIVLPARNACHDIAARLGLTYFLELDDDYNSFMLRYESKRGLSNIIFSDLDYVFDCFLDFLDESGALTVAMAQGGDLMGGVESRVFQERLVRKVMNSFFCRTDRPFKFLGRLNEDVNFYVTAGNIGQLTFTYSHVMLNQATTQANQGGLTDAYLEHGTYKKSFYSVICAPQAVTVFPMGTRNFRMHHRVDWDKCAPKILSARWRKTNGEEGLDERHG